MGQDRHDARPTEAKSASPRLPIRPVLSRSVTEDAKEMKAQARAFVYRLRLHIFPPVVERLPRVIQDTGIKWEPYTQAVLAPSVSKPPTAWVRVACASALRPGRPECEDPGPLVSLPPVCPVLGCWAPRLTARQQSGARCCDLS